MFSRNSFPYFPLREEKPDDDISLENGTDQRDTFIGQRASCLPKKNRKTTVACVFLTVVILLATHYGVFILGTWWRPNLARQCLEYTSMWSPALEHMDPEYHLVQFNGTLGHATEYTGDPSPEVDAVWENWSFVKYASLPEETMKKLPESMDSARFTPEYGGGYIGFLEVSHHIHCLNVLRKAVYSDYYMSPEHLDSPFTDEPFVVSMHIKHCIEQLRQNIMCNADTGIITHHWVKDDPDPFANFNTWHKCRDISSVEKWIHDNAIPAMPNETTFPIPAGSRIFDLPP